MSILDAQIDPVLLNQTITPAMRMLERAKAVELVPPAPTSSSSAATQGFRFHDDDDDFEMSANGSVTPTTPLATSPHSVLLKASVNSRLITLANSLKASKKLPPKTISDIDRYLNASDLEERLFLTFFMAAEARDHLDRMVKPSNWIFTEELKKTIARYVKVFVLSTTTKSYKGNAAEEVVAAMRELQIPDLPGDKDVVQLDMVHTLIKDKLADARNTLKKKIVASIEPDSLTANVAALAAEVIGKSSVKHTYQLYVRLAFLHFVAVEYGSDSHYWNHVDGALRDFITAAGSEEGLTRAFNLTYEDDKKKYGDPADTNYEVVQPVHANNEFAKVIERHANATVNKKRRIED